MRTIHIFSETLNLFHGVVVWATESGDQWQHEHVSAPSVWNKMFGIGIIASVVCGLFLSVYFVHTIVSDQYAISVLTKEINKTEGEYQALLAEYSELQSLSSVSEAKLTSAGFQNIDTPRYIGGDTILQANATVR